MQSYEGSCWFRQRLVLATLSGKPVKIKNIRHRADNPGVLDFEAGFIRLLDKITNGSRIEVNETGTTVTYWPGMLYGGTVEHECNTQRSIGYYLEPLLYMAPFCKKPIRATLSGITNDSTDPSVDIIQRVSLMLLNRLGIDEGLELKVLKRGAPPGGGGEVLFTCPIVRQLRPVKLLDQGKVRRIRGWSYSTRVSPGISNRIVESAKSVLLQYIPDIYIYTDHMKGKQSGKSPGFGLSLVAETTTGTLLSAEQFSNYQGHGEPTVPEELGKNVAHLLLEEIYRGGCVDSMHQSLTLLYMVLGQNDVSKLKTGPLSPYTMQFLRHIRDFFGVMFKVEAEKRDDDDSTTGSDKIILTCVGAGFTNLSKTTK